MTQTQQDELNRAREVLKELAARLSRDAVNTKEEIAYRRILKNAGDAYYAIMILNRIDGKEAE